MTEQQIKQLKEILDLSQCAENSSELDQRILQAAQAKTLLSESDNDEKSTWVNGFKRILAHGFSQAAVASLIFTFALFLGMGYVTKVDNNSISTKQQLGLEEYIDITDKKDNKKTTQIAISKPDFIINQAPQTENMRDALLAKMTIPNTQLLLDDTQFPQLSDRDLARDAINMAMNDIQFMINQGAFNEARLRYARLKESCQGCSLPESLDAMALNSQIQQADSS